MRTIDPADKNPIINSKKLTNLQIKRIHTGSVCARIVACPNCESTKLVWDQRTSDAYEDAPCNFFLQNYLFQCECGFRFEVTVKWNDRGSWRGKNE